MPSDPGQPQRTHEILDEADTLDGIDGLGVLLYRHARNACRPGSWLSVDEIGKLASDQNAAGLQVTSARLTGRPFGIYVPNGPGRLPLRRRRSSRPTADDDRQAAARRRR